MGPLERLQRQRHIKRDQTPPRHTESRGDSVTLSRRRFLQDTGGIIIGGALTFSGLGRTDPDKARANAEYETLPILSKAQIDQNFDNAWAQGGDKAITDGGQGVWKLGPKEFAEVQEPFKEAPGGKRWVRYYDHGRQEDASYSTSDPLWQVTMGLLARDLMLGQKQVGLNSFIDMPACTIPVAGDADDPNGATYASFASVKDNTPIPDGWIYTQTINNQGIVGTDNTYLKYNVKSGPLVPETDHRIADVFNIFMDNTAGKQYGNKFYSTGYPLTEAYWEDVKVGGVIKHVLVQVFERRVLTYTPSNDLQWQVENGNVGQHYYQAVYGELPGQNGNTVENPNNDFHTSEGNGWAFLVAEKDIHGAPPVQIIADPDIPDAVNKLNQVPSLMVAGDPSLAGRTIELVLLQSLDQIKLFGLNPNVNPYTSTNEGFNTRVIADKNNIMNQQVIGEEWGITGDETQGPAYIFLRPDVLSDPSVLGKVGATAEDLKRSLIDSAVEHMLGDAKLTGNPNDLNLSQSLTDYIASYTSLIANPY